MAEDFNDLKNNPELQPLLNELRETSEWKEVESLGGDPFNVCSKYAGYAFKVHPHDQELRLKFIRFHLAKEITILNARDNRGMIIGTVDECFESAKNKPETYIVVLNDGELRKVSSYSQNLVTKPGIYTLNVKYDATYNSYQAKGCLLYEQFTMNPIDLLKKLAYTPSSPEWDDGTIDPSKYQPVVIKGKIVSGYPIAVYEDRVVVDENGNSDTKSVHVGDQPIYQPNSRTPIAEMCPVMTLNLDSEGSQNRIVLNFRKTKYGIPYFGFKDFNSLASLAIEESDDPKEQMNRIMSEIEGLEVIVIGYVLSSKLVTPRDGDSYNKITIRGCSVLDCNYNSFVDNTKNSVESPIERLAKKAGVESKSEKTETKPVSKKEENTLVVEAPIVESPKKSGKSKKLVIPEYDENPEEFFRLVVYNGVETAKIWGKDIDEITVDYIKGVTTGIEIDAVPPAIWTRIVKRVKTELATAYENE